MAITVIVLALVSTQLYRNYQVNDNSKDFAVDEYARTFINKFPQDAVVLSMGDLPTNSLHYMHIVEGLRKDITLISTEHMTYTWYLRTQKHFFKNATFPGHTYHPYLPGAFNMKQFIEANQDEYPLFFFGGMRQDDPSINQATTGTTFGSGFFITSTPLSNKEKVQLIRHWMPTELEKYKDKKYHFVSWENKVQQTVANHKRVMAQALLNHAIDHPQDKESLKQCIQANKYYLKYAEHDQTALPYVYEGLANCFTLLHRTYVDRKNKAATTLAKNAIVYFTKAKAFGRKAFEKAKLDNIQTHISFLQNTIAEVK